MFTNDASIKLFADDIKIYIEIRDPYQAVDFQDCINSIASWAVKWQLKFSVNKCRYMQISYVTLIVPRFTSWMHNLTHITYLYTVFQTKVPPNSWR